MNATEAALHASMTTIVNWMVIIFVLVVCVSLCVSIFRIVWLPKLKGKLGEANINFWIKRLLDEGYQLIPNVTLPTADDRTTQIDHIIVSRYGIFVIETKTYKGWIFGGERDAEWTQVIYKNKERFQNPLRQNYKHVKTLSELTGIPIEYFKSVVVFAGECKFKSAMPANVVHLCDFIKHIKSHQNIIIKDEQISEITDTIQQWARTVTEDKKAAHVKNLRKNREPVAADTDEKPSCPRCGQQMVLRKNQKQGSQFWGCPGYPKCRGTRPA